jgi:hypothetical protein
MKVIFKFKNGREKSMPERMARTLQVVGRGTYMTRDMAAAPSVVAPVLKPTRNVDELDEMDAEALHALAKERNVPVHHRAGADKVRAALREAAK